MQFSIIIPVHNAEKYLLECLNSVNTQEFDDFEIILVVNASTDSSLQICHKWAENRRNVVILVTEVPGVSNARNMGIEAAKGEWLVFLDSDDCMRNNALSILKLGIISGYDFVIANYSSDRKQRKYSGAEKVVPSIDYQKALLDRAQYFGKINSGLTWNAIVLDSVWAKAYKAVLVKEQNIRFREDVSIGEDLLFNMAYSAHIQQVYCEDEDVYYYRVIMQSVSRISDISAVEKRVKFLEALKDMTLPDELIPTRNFKLVDILLRSIIAGTQKKEDIDKTYDRIVVCLKDDKVQHAIQECRGKKLSNGKMRNIFYSQILKMLKMKQYQKALRCGFLYNKLINTKENFRKKN